MKEYYVAFGTGAGDEFCATLEEAKQYADDHAAYTQHNITIFDDDDNVVATRRWWGYEYDDDNDYQEDPICFGRFGFYGDWIER